MKTIKKHYGWVIVAILASLPLLVISSMINFNPGNGQILSLVTDESGNSESTLQMLYHVTGEFAIRWMTAVLTLTPIFIIFGVTNIFVRQAMGIATAIWSFLHFIIFIWIEGFLTTFNQVNYIAGFIAILILIPLLVTSNRKSMKILKGSWKKLQSFVYVAIFLSLFHIAILEKPYLFYALIVGLGFIIRVPIVKNKFINLRQRRKK
jgi:sulfoxide reductase heme-binding subunit YedZ